MCFHSSVGLERPSVKREVNGSIPFESVWTNSVKVITLGFGPSNPGSSPGFSF